MDKTLSEKAVHVAGSLAVLALLAGYMIAVTALAIIGWIAVAFVVRVLTGI